MKRLFEYALVTILVLGGFAIALKPIGDAIAQAFVTSAARIDAASNGRY